MIPILCALAVVILLIIVVVAGRPDEFVISRATRISAPPDKVFPRVNELRKWDDWSPWAKLDPDAKNTFEGPASGVGAAMAWDGNKKVGAGKMTIIESHPSDLVRIKLEFLRPFQATNTAEFNFKSESAQTLVTWSMSGKSSLFFKAISLLMSFDEMIGKDFEKGLASLKAVAELVVPTAKVGN